jgi:putative nucleotidyltransferase with HDIG domain
VITQAASTPAPGTGAAAAPAGGDEVLSRRTELVLRELDGLPTLAPVAAKLLALGTREDADVKEIVRVVESDPALTVRLLALCRRAAYRTRVPITTVEMAVVMLGLDAVRSLALSVEIFDWTSRAEAARRAAGPVGAATARGRASTRPGSGSVSAAASDPKPPPAPFDRAAFWQHSIAVACAAELIAREHPELELAPEECFVGGLIHDLGKVALELVLPRAYARVVELAETRRGNIADFERPIVGLDHLAAGARLAERWGLPEPLLTVIARHDRPFEDAPGLDAHRKRTLAVVHVADALCRRLSLGWSGNHALAADERTAWAAAGLRPERVAGVAPRLYEAVSARMKDLGLGDEPSQRMLLESILRANARLGRVNQDLIEANARLEEAQRELAEARAMARLGEMTAGAAHEMNNPLAVISGRAQALAQRARDEPERSAARAIVDAAGRLSALIARLNRIASPPAPEPDVLDLRDLLEGTVRAAKDAFGDRVQARGQALPAVMGVKLTVAEGLEAARLDGALLREALVEIIVNALEAGPRSRVEVRAEVDRARDRLLVRVSDDGVGMNAHALEHATDPFFSAKPAGRQTGLGLALAHRLVGALGGEVAIASRPGRGTAVTVALPEWRAGAAARVARRPGHAA